ncbi:hypothetical protein [Streptomyces sp. DH12]|uniref:hypothetical protein n=1 Tax=Streptomyces sp. DH12 TaxID=2857010 RepID=UPI001E29D2E0|nr:hypothetical protein [Streptomyces sp. DH12]
MATIKVIPPELAQRIADLATSTSATPLHEARIFVTLAAAGYTTDEIAGMAGRRPRYISWCLDLLGLLPSGQADLEAGRLPVTLAWHVARLSSANQNLLLVRWARGGFSSARHAERYARAIAADETGTPA